MKRKVRIEIDPGGEEEVVIRCHELTEEIMLLKKIAENGSASVNSDIILSDGGIEYIVPLGDVLFFESNGDKTLAHTASRTFCTEKTLSRLTDELGGSFFRVSKSCIANITKISSMQRELTGICEATFYGCDKKIFISRMYYKAFRERLNEVRLGK